MARALWRVACRTHPRHFAQSVIEGWARHDVLTYASAIAFKVFFALIPLTLFAVGVLAMFDLSEAWETDLAPDVRGAVSDDLFRVIDDTVRRVLDSKPAFWATAGALLTLWGVSGAVRALMGSFNRIYGTEDRRSWQRRYAISFALGAAAAVLFIVAFAVVRFGPLLVDGGPVLDVASVIVRVGIAAALLLTVVALLVRFAPVTSRPWRWVTSGAVISVGGWWLMSIGFWWYLANVADYGSVFGNLATLVIVMEYLYLSVIVFLTGVMVDGFARARVGEEHPEAAG